MAKTVLVKEEEMDEFLEFKKAKLNKENENKRKEDREVYNQMVDEEIASTIPELLHLSTDIKAVKAKVIENFNQIIQMKSSVMGKVKSGQRSHTFTNKDATMRVQLGQYVTDGWRDTVEDGLEMAKDSVMSLIKDDETKVLVNQIMRLLSKDNQGNLKASKVLQLRKMANELNNDKLNEGIRIIEESFLPSVSKVFIRAEYKGKNNEWIQIPLGITEA